MVFYFEQGARLLNQIRDLPNGSPGAFNAISDYYHVMTNARPYTRINNSLFMTQVNYLLRLKGFDAVDHGFIDHLAHRFGYLEFRTIFRRHYDGTLPLPRVAIDGVNPNDPARRPRPALAPAVPRAPILIQQVEAQIAREATPVTVTPMEDVPINVISRSAPQQCAYCHDDLSQAETVCNTCGVVLHTECAHLNNGRCTTLGCVNELQINVVQANGFFARLGQRIGRFFGRRDPEVLGQRAQ